MKTGPFRVIVVGGGPVGLTAAHVLAKAGIDYVVLERRDEIVEDVGASLVLGPSSIRLYSQLGLLSKLDTIGATLTNNITVTLDGKPRNDAKRMIELFKKSIGITPVICHRAHVVKLLHDSLDDANKARIHTGKRVSDIQVLESGVSVRCADGIEFPGSIVIGTDGVHSRVAQCMRELAVKANPAAADINDERPFLAEYRTMWCCFPLPAGHEPGDAGDAHGSGICSIYMCGIDRCWMFLYEKFAQPTRERHRYNEEDVREFADRFADVAITEKLRVKDVFSQKFTAGMVDLEEGILPHWSWHRIVLAGDACHKFTPTQGLGYNNGAQDIVALANELHAALQSESQKGDGGAHDLGLHAISGVFARYKETRRANVTEDLKLSAMTTRLSAWPNVIYKVADYFMLYIAFLGRLILNTVCKRVATALVLDFVSGKEPIQGDITWVHPIKE